MRKGVGWFKGVLEGMGERGGKKGVSKCRCGWVGVVSVDRGGGGVRDRWERQRCADDLGLGGMGMGCLWGTSGAGRSREVSF